MYGSVVLKRMIFTGKYYVFNLRYNQLKRFESGVFKTPLISLPKFSTLDISASTTPHHIFFLISLY